MQITAAAVVCLVAAAFHPGAFLTLPTTESCRAVLIYLAVIPGAAAMLAPSFAQAHIETARAAIIMSTEPVWASIIAVVFTGEVLTWGIAAGGGLILEAVILIEARQLRKPSVFGELLGGNPSNRCEPGYSLSVHPAFTSDGLVVGDTEAMSKWDQFQPQLPPDEDYFYLQPPSPEPVDEETGTLTPGTSQLQSPVPGSGLTPGGLPAAP